MRKPISLLIVLTIALVAVGCGPSAGSDSSADDPTTTTTTTTTTTEAEAAAAEGTDEEYLAALTANLSSGSVEDGNLVIEDDEAACVAPKWLETVTTEGFTSVGASPDDVAEPDFEYAVLELDADRAQQMIDSFEDCGVDIYAKLAESFTIGLTEAQQSCAMEEVDPKVANDLLLTAFSTESGDGSTEFTALLDQLKAACDLPAN